jgi:hypothetical protein
VHERNDRNIIQECLDYALADRSLDGVWGGTTKARSAASAYLKSGS